MLRRFPLLVLMSCWSLSAVASIDIQASAPDEHFSSFYQIDETAAQPTDFQNPVEMVGWAEELLRELKIDITNWAFTNSPMPEAAEKYNRDKHFGPWKNDPTDNTCLNTRGKVLLRDSAASVTYNSSGCTIATGLWHEPYLGATYTSSKDIQIDHVVPLKNAYISGAFQWDSHTRCVYANFMGNDFHLLPVDGRSNMRKGDQTPAGWMPANQAYACEYLKNWLSIKLIWKLRINPKEAAAVERVLNAANCDMTEFKFTKAELARQRGVIAANNWCTN